MNNLIGFITVLLLQVVVLSLIVNMTLWLTNTPCEWLAYFHAIKINVDSLKDNDHMMVATSLFMLFILVGLPLFFASLLIIKDEKK